MISSKLGRMLNPSVRQKGKTWLSAKHDLNEHPMRAHHRAARFRIALDDELGCRLTAKVDDKAKKSDSSQ